MARKWTEDEDDIIRAGYGKRTNADLAETIGDCIPLQIYRRAIKLGLESEPSKEPKEKGQVKSPAAASKSAKQVKPAKRTRVLVEPEIAAMQIIADALDPLESAAQKRVFKNMNDRFGLFKIAKPEPQADAG